MDKAGLIRHGSAIWSALAGHGAPNPCFVKNVLSGTGAARPASKGELGCLGRKGLTMRGMPVLSAVAIGAAAVLSGCGQQHGTGAGAAPPAPSSSATAGPGPSALCAGGRPARHARLTITGADSGSSFCVTRGTNVTVFLKGTPARKWSPIKAAGSALRPSASGELALALGVTGASFAAVRSGTAIITSGRPACGPGDTASSTGSMSCTAILAFRVTVTVLH